MFIIYVLNLCISTIYPFINRCKSTKILANLSHPNIKNSTGTPFNTEYFLNFVLGGYSNYCLQAESKYCTAFRQPPEYREL